ncbi:hypothetical protein Schulenberg_081 [Escherichia phage Schulenburg]|nr:hypothetical protein Schulenberg_081 [Escherichia phage Schulenburg]
MKQFFISYNWSNGRSSGFGNCTASPKNGEKFTLSELRIIEDEAKEHVPHGAKAIIMCITEIAPE